MKKNNAIVIIVLVSLLLPITSACINVKTSNDRIDSNDFKVVGYYSGDLFNEPVEKIQTEKLTHIMYSFVIPKTDGTLHELKNPEQLKELVEKAHKDGTKVFISLGGWSYEGNMLEPVFKELASTDVKREIFIENVCAMVDEYNLDGVELDWEHPNKGTADIYEKLVIELSDALNLKGKELTAALNGSWYEDWAAEDTSVITERCLERFSFINVMAYDMNNADHSPIWFFENSISYWLNRGLPHEKIIMGIPLYAKPSWKQYRHLVAENPEYAFTDYAPTTPLESYYNGINTLREKTVIALNRAGGLMLFDVNEDTNDQYSIVSMIHDMLKRTEKLTKEELGNYVTVVIDNRELVFNEEEGYGVPYIDNRGRLMVPIRKSLEAIGAEVSYDSKKQIITAKKSDEVINVPVGKKYMEVNGQNVKLDTSSVVNDNRTYIPVRAVFNALGYEVQWHDNSNTAILIK
ncbi:MAG: glycosyl hydrolase family 18 protein [Sedimentibacter sp.]|uniref:glycosyl hydrolase family 18 protein n=1 Tax=Sedimentibacter sp. TaxID=1960295 RepID=UPI0031597184